MGSMKKIKPDTRALAKWVAKYKDPMSSRVSSMGFRCYILQKEARHDCSLEEELPWAWTSVT